MPRDSNGNYVLPAGNPVVSGELIASSWANPTMQDIAVELTNSLDRQGRGGMLAPFKFADGTVGAPSLTFNNEPTTGIYRFGPQDMRVSIAGVDKFRFYAGGAQVWDPLATPSPAFAGVANQNQIDAINVTLGTLSGYAKLDTANTFTQAQQISNAAPTFTLFQTDGLADEKNWSWIVDGQILSLRAINDAASGSSTPFAISRAGANITGIALAATTITANGVSVRDAALFNAGTLADARLSSNVAFLNGNLAFTTPQEINAPGSHLTLRETDGPDPADRTVLDMNGGVFSLYTNDNSTNTWQRAIAMDVVSGQVSIGSSSSAAGAQIRLQTRDGYVDIGPANAGLCHFVTDRPGFYFAQPVQVNGDITRYTMGNYLYQAAAGLSGAVSRGTVAPSGGADGDVYFQYT